MKRNNIFFALVLALGLAVVLPLEASAEICNRVVAIVNSEVITLHELNTRMKEITGVEATALKTRNEGQYLQARQQILDLLIEEKIAEEQIREKGISVPDSDVDAAIERIKKDNGLTQEDLLAQLAKRKIDLKTYRQNIKRDLQRMQLINYEVKSKIIIREESLKEYYEAHKAEFSKDERVHLATIFLTAESVSGDVGPNTLLEKAQEILSRLNKGEDFAKLATRFSKGPGANDGGDLGFFKTDQLDPQLVKIIHKTPEGGVSDPIPRPAGLQIIKVVEREKGGEKPFEEVKDAIYQALYREEVNKRYMSWIKELKERTYTKIIF
jgi:peptidyl-prolyl cis-trans isomerase SurA